MLIVLICKANTISVLDELPQKIIPYFVMEQK
jgi:hypothetical protein